MDWSFFSLNYLINNPPIIRAAPIPHAGFIPKYYTITKYAVAMRKGINLNAPVSKVPNANFEDCVTCPWHLVADKFPALKLVNDRLKIRTNMRVLFRHSTQIALELWGKSNLDSRFRLH